MIVPSGTFVGVGDATGVDEVGVAVSTGVDDVGVAVSPGVEEVGVALSTGVEEVGVVDSTGVEVEEVGVALSTGVVVSTGVEEVGVAVSTGVADVGVGDSAGVEGMGVGVSNGVGVKLGVGTSPTIVRFVPVDGKLVSILSPLDTRTVHSMGVCPACKPVALKVKAGPLAVALLPLLPAIATMKLPFWGPLIATAGSGPNRLVTAILLTCTNVAL